MRLGDRVVLVVFGRLVASDDGGWLLHLEQLNDDEVTKSVFPLQQIHVGKDYPMSKIPDVVEPLIKEVENG